MRQVYVAPGSGGWEGPKRLGGWQKVALAVGAGQQVEVGIDPRLLATWDEARREWRVAGGTYQVMLGASARDIKQTVTVNVPARTLPAGWHPAR